MSIETYCDNYLQHHGIKGQKWGIRRFQNEDGSYKSGAEGRYKDSDSNINNKKGLTNKQKKALKIAAWVTVAAAATVGAVFVAKKLNAKVTSSMVKNCTSLGKKYLAKANSAYSTADFNRRVLGDSISESKFNSIGDYYMKNARKYRSLANNPSNFTLGDKYQYVKGVSKDLIKNRFS